MIMVQTQPLLGVTGHVLGVSFLVLAFCMWPLRHRSWPSGVLVLLGGRRAHHICMDIPSQVVFSRGIIELLFFGTVLCLLHVTLILKMSSDQTS